MKEFEKKYSVYIEEDTRLGGEYMYCKPEDAPKKSKNRNFIMTYFFKKTGKDRNPMMVIDNLDGAEFKHRHDIILDFEEHCALSYSVETDGLLHVINPDQERKSADEAAIDFGDEDESE